MSRLIVKNLPTTITEQKIRDLFGQKGLITDIQLKFKDGKFRKFGFVGYENQESAAEATKFFDNTFIGTSKIKVDICAALGDESKPKSWSKHAKDSEIYKKKNEKKPEPESLSEEPEPTPETKKKSKNAIKIEAIIGDRKSDPMFKEFMMSHAKDSLAWENDVGVEKEEEERATSQANESGNNDETSDKKLADKEISDKDYMKHLMGKDESKQSVKEPRVKFEKAEKKSKSDLVRLFTIKIKNLPSKVKREELIKFFRPSKAHSVRIPRTSGFAYVGFKLERDMQRALLKDKSFFKGKQIIVYDFTEKNFLPEGESNVQQRQNPRWEQQQDLLKNEEAICDSGKLFFRNLAYTVTETDLQALFETYGTVVDVNIPIDSVTRKIKGFGTVTFMMPEHAVVAYTELNGTMFHGRMFHVMPGKANDRNNDDDEGGGNFKKKKQQELRKTAGLSHNWNTLFLGTNAVAEVMSKTYGKSKEEVLDSSTGGSNAAVRLALGETQIVLEMKSFLESNGVRLEAFDDDNSKRSKTTILAKNLPTGTDVEELRQRFEEFGVIEKILLPPSGITCLVKFEQPSEARKAFRRLAYSKFKHLPLYLEWAPENTFKQDKDLNNDETEVLKKEEEKEIQENVEIDSKAVDLSEDEDDSSPEPNTTLFMKNLNFETTESTIRDCFKHLGAIHVIQIAKKRNPENPQLQIPLGYGFIQFKKTSTAEKAIRSLQFCVIDDKQIELKRSDRTIQGQNQAEKKPSKKADQKTSTKIMVRNIPFQANIGEIKDLFKTFGELKAVRLPKKMSSDQHRGFGFIDFVNKTDAKNAFEALHHSTHLYGRRLVLEWAEADQDVEEIRKRTAEQMGTEESNPKKRKKGLLKDEDFIKFNSDNEEEN